MDSSIDPAGEWNRVARGRTDNNEGSWNMQVYNLDGGSYGGDLYYEENPY